MEHTRRTVLKTTAAAVAAAFLPQALAANLTPTKKALKIGVVGAGLLGGTVGRLLVQAGHEVMFSARDVERVRRRFSGAREQAGTPLQAAQFGDVVLFALPYSALPEVAERLASALQGKIVLDAMNPWGEPAMDARVEKEAQGVIGQLTAKLLPGARLVRVFSSIDATQIAASAQRDGDRLAVPLASDDAQALALATELVREVGCEPVPVGKLLESRRYQRGSNAFRVHVGADELRKRLGLAPAAE